MVVVVIGENVKLPYQLNLRGIEISWYIYWFISLGYLSLAKLEYNIDKDRKKRKMEDDFACVCVCLMMMRRIKQGRGPDSEKSEISNGGARRSRVSVTA